MKRIGVLVIRGSGGSGFERQKKFINKVNNRLTKNNIDINEIAYVYVDWYAPLQDQQENLLTRMLKNDNLNLKSKTLRKFLITNISDLINYGGKPNLPDQAYEKTHLMVYNSILNLQNQIIENAPLIIVASSMGTEIIHNYIWDRQFPVGSDAYGNTPFERFETLVGLFTFGNNIPIFSSSSDIDALVPIKFPDNNILSQLKHLAIWENYYDKNDPLGYPIKFINENYMKANVTDIQIGVGNILSFWNILSHFGYWTSRKLQKRLSDYILMVMKGTA